MEVMKVTPYSSAEKEGEGTPVRPIVCLKRNMDLKRFEQMEDCFILDFDPFESVDITNLSLSSHLPDDHQDVNDLSVIAEKGQVACRDYPHSRHLCLKFPFETTAHESYCKLCYCYVCDLAAPCQFWEEPEREGEAAHCHASEYTGNWKLLRILKKIN